MQELLTLMEAWLGGPLLLALAAAFGGGVLVSLSPCVYPLIPIISAFVCSRALGAGSRLASFGLSLAYVAGMALVYTLLGVLAALTGGLFGQVSTSPLAQFMVANLLILFGLHLLEALPLPALPAWRSFQTRRKGALGALLLGAASGLIASPCASPVLGALLTYVGSRQNVLLGALLLFVFSLGMGVLLVAVGTFSGLAVALPRPGRWMVVMKRILGLAMLGLGEYFLVRTGMLLL